MKCFPEGICFDRHDQRDHKVFNVIDGVVWTAWAACAQRCSRRRRSQAPRTAAVACPEPYVPGSGAAAGWRRGRQRR